MASLSNLDPHKHPWLQAAALRRIFDAVKGSGGEARVVGGAVRNALLERAPSGRLRGAQSEPTLVGEIDLAVNLPPEKVTQILTKAGIKVVPTGIEHGTITAVVDHKGYEITTLRRDVETFGRH